jgi:hypothetical protein
MKQPSILTPPTSGVNIHHPAGANTYSVNLTASIGAGADTKE